MPTPEEYAAKKLQSIRANSDQTKSKSGPRTPEGQARSKMNALRHGLSGRIVVLPSEDMSQYLKFSKDFVDSLYPATPLESELAQTVADGYWRLKRFRTVEEGMLAMGHYEEEGDFDAASEEVDSAFTAAKAFRANSNAFVNLSIYEQRIHRGIEKSMKQLREAQAERKARKQEELAMALRLRAFNKMQNLPYDPAVDGFVYSPKEIEIEAHRYERRENAYEAMKAGFNYPEYLKRIEKIAA